MTDQITPEKHKPLTNINQMYSQRQHGITDHNNEAYRTSLLQLTKEDKSSSFKTKIIILNNILKEYETWVNIILSIINDKSSTDNHINLGTPIQKGLEHISKIQSDNLKIKQKLIEQITKNSNLEHQLREMKTLQKWRKDEYEQCKGDAITAEKQQLMRNLQLVANELDEQSEKNRYYKEIMCKEDNIIYQNAMNEYVRLTEENLILKQVIELRNEKNNLLYSEWGENGNEMMMGNHNNIIEDMKSMTSRYSLIQKDYNTNNTTRRLGNYLLEGEEDWRDDTGIFTCNKL